MKPIYPICMALLHAAGLLLLPTAARPQAAGDWPCYGRDPGGARFSPLTQIRRQNVARLKVAWTYHTGERFDPPNGVDGAFEATPILAGGTLYVSTPFSRVVAIDPDTGQEKWTFDPEVDRSPERFHEAFVTRGVSTWLDPRKPRSGAPLRRIYLATGDGRLAALRADNGKLCPDFGASGWIDLKTSVGEIFGEEYQVTSPPAVIGDLVIVGSSIPDNHRVNMPSGVVRAFDARTGALRWRFDPIPIDPRDPAWSSWSHDRPLKTGAANAWAPISTDPQRGLVFVPTGAPSPDFYGGERIGDNHYANSVVALRARDGKVMWSFQVVHHDLWDYDIPAQPVLLTVKREDRDVAAVAVATKMGRIFVLDRETGAPLFPVEERPAPQGAIAGEKLSPTQPYPLLPPPLSPQGITLDDAWGPTPDALHAARERIASLRNEGIFAPPSEQGTIISPSNVGGMNWSGMCFDPIHGLLVANTNRLATVVYLVPRTKAYQEFRAHPESENTPQAGTPYAMRRDWLLSPLKLPMTRPPWGMLSAVDVNRGAIRWEVPLGTIPGLSALPGYEKFGSINLGGSIVTAGGLVFIAAAMDNCLRAFDVETGKELWKGELPAGGQATPMTYRSAKTGKQYVIICAGGHRGLNTKRGDAVVAFSLP